MNLRTLLAVTALLGATAVPLADAATPKITFKGVGRVKLGRTSHGLRSEHLIGRLKKGCELAGPNLRVASLRPPLKGSVEFFKPKLRAFQITITDGAKANGVGVGATLARVKAKFPHRQIDHSGESTFGLTFVDVPNKRKPKLQIAVDPKTRRVTMFGIPTLAFCE
jgi:hypothetical protein